jgi:putative chitobiose transport system substrate-binding protein
MQLRPAFTDYMNELIAKFESEHPGIKVNWVDAPAQEYETKLLSLIIGRRAPDVININNEMMVRLNDRNLLLSLEDLVTSEVRSRYIPTILESGCSIDGKLYALPWYQATKVLMYNRDLMTRAGLDPDQPPKTRSEIFAASRTIHEKTRAFGFLPNLTEDGELKNILAREGIPLVNETRSQATFNIPEAVNIVAELKDLYDKGVIPRESIRAEHRRSLESFKSGRSAFLVSGPQFLRLIRNEAPDLYKNVGVSTVPPIGNTGLFEVDTQNLVLFKNTPHPEAALALAKFVTNAENQLEFTRTVTIFPSVLEALDDPHFSAGGDSPEDQARLIGARQMRSAGILVPPLPRLGELNRAMEDAARNAMTGRATPAAAIEQAANRWNEILARP